MEDADPDPASKKRLIFETATEYFASISSYFLNGTGTRY